MIRPVVIGGTLPAYRLIFPTNTLTDIEQDTGIGHLNGKIGPLPRLRHEYLIGLNQVFKIYAYNYVTTGPTEPGQPPGVDTSFLLQYQFFDKEDVPLINIGSVPEGQAVLSNYNVRMLGAGNLQCYAPMTSYNYWLDVYPKAVGLGFSLQKDSSAGDRQTCSTLIDFSGALLI